MEQNLNQTQVPQNQPLNEQRVGGQKGMRTVVMILIILADIAFALSFIYVLGLLIMGALGVNISPLFGGDYLDKTLGISGIVGGLLVIAIVITAIILIAIASILYNITRKYYRLLKFAKEQNMDVVIAKRVSASYLIGMIFFTLVIAFFSLTLILNKFTSIFAILIYLSTVLCILTVIFSIVHMCINRSRYKKLSPEEQEKIEELCLDFNKKFKKKEIRRTTGKLY